LVNKAEDNLFKQAVDKIFSKDGNFDFEVSLFAVINLAGHSKPYFDGNGRRSAKLPPQDCSI